MYEKIEIIRVDEESQQGFIIAMNSEEVVVENITLGRFQIWEIEDFRQCVKFV